MRALFVSGSSGGHLTPLVAVERALKKLSPKAQTHFLCSSKREDAEYLEHEGVAFTQSPRPKKNIFFPVTYLAAKRVARKTLKRFQPDVIFSKGGAVSVPLLRAAKKKGIPYVIHESDSVMGKANRMVAKDAAAICLGFPPSDEQRMFGVEPVVTGNPIRPEVTKGSRARGLKLTNLTGRKPVLLVMGGSQGAEALNEAVLMHIDKLLTFCDVVHLTGPGKTNAGRRAGYWFKPFVYEELPDLYAIADIAVSRAGASSIAELGANKIPMILVPIRGLANDHQFENAVRAEREGAAIMLPQNHLDRDLSDAVKHLLENREKKTQMSTSALRLAHPEAARHIAKILLECVAKRKKSH
ncbi:MAG TPA: UDP-N-acetylglucosamine--N-acetylmuramyl-(pentapeptide) pyrophosphoryl-undecaprenol N-acetylglucosamine transferase [Candidatus Peribacteraceae bacterium]|nr:UDP-N-acetylglucosamine--N-acetylmuramyl-(pentapeptide) pyrophosphoryl-undecaprenol N-acetylglucosamine transferase [Candidatus Peribacteraceae bacterium]